jgi:DeoR family suf operon transcriptional repressor
VTSRWPLLGLLKRLGESDAAELAEARGISASAVRQQLDTMLDNGLVQRRHVATGRRGRPTVKWSLTAKGHQLFPYRYDALATDVLGHLAEIDDSLVDEVFERRRRERVKRARERLAAHDTVDARVEELARILDDDGYVAEAIAPEPDDPTQTWRVVEHHCAIFDVAERYRSACITELEFIREALPDAEVERVHHILGGDSNCGYEIRFTPPSRRTPARRRRTAPAARTPRSGRPAAARRSA